ncbi:MAG: 23S rRNA (pseudouridine(1915)-N(3))-methyltransferase RlmH [Bacteroidales bacterium]|nr:23S rRNA (pseudouridine(1915)-N(3))-methyltransferase RlmH [Bacteroidales bacterium]
MKLLILMVGKMANSTISQMFDEYIERVKHYIPTEVTMVYTKTTAKQMAQQRDEEGKLLLGQIKTDDYVVLLDDKGKEYTSQTFAKWIEQKQNSTKRLVFVIVCFRSHALPFHINWYASLLPNKSIAHSPSSNMSNIITKTAYY